MRAIRTALISFGSVALATSLATSRVQASAFRCAETFVPSIPRTVGAEIEFESPDVLHIADPIRFQRQHQLASRLDNGVWVANRIPSNILARVIDGFYDSSGSSADFYNILYLDKGEVGEAIDELDPTKSILLDRSPDGSYRMRNWGQIRSKSLAGFLYRLFSERGRLSDELKLAVTHHQVQNLPVFLSEEWLDNSLAGFEYSMNGGVATAAQAKSWTEVLRRTVTNPRDRSPRAKYDSAPVHFHVLYDVEQLLDSEQRQKSYQAILDLAGDLNDLQFVKLEWWRDRALRVQFKVSPQDLVSEVEFAKVRTNLIHEELLDRLEATPFKTFTGKMWDALRATPDGVELLQNGVDPFQMGFNGTGLPEIFKLLPLGIRTIYGLPATRTNAALPRVGLEFRGFFHNDVVLNALFNPHAQEGTVPRLSTSSASPRGIRVYTWNQFAYSTAQALSPDFQKYLEEALQHLRVSAEQRQKWHTEQINALLMWPASRMIRSPVFSARVDRLPSEARELVKQGEELRFKRYLQELRSIEARWRVFDKLGLDAESTRGERIIVGLYEAALNYAQAYGPFFSHQSNKERQ